MTSYNTSPALVADIRSLHYTSQYEICKYYGKLISKTDWCNDKFFIRFQEDLSNINEDDLVETIERLPYSLNDPDNSITYIYLHGPMIFFEIAEKLEIKIGSLLSIPME